MHDLNLPRFAALVDRELDELGRALHAWLASRGRNWEYLGVARFASQAVLDEDEQRERRTLHWRDRASRVIWVVVPGEEFAPGYDERRLDLLRTCVLQMEPDVDDSARPNLDQHIMPYAAGAGWNPARLHLGARQRVEPLLMTAVPLLQSTPGIARCIEQDRVRLFGWNPGRLDVLAFHPHEMQAVLADMDCRLPTAIEMQWAMAGGQPWLFPWGDALPRWMWAEEFWARDDAAEEYERRFDAAFRFGYERDEPEWSRSNRFGLVDALAASCFCTIDGKLGYVGGAAECFPWQGCGEWAGFLCAGAVELAPGSDDRSCGLRPVISLASFSRA